MTPSTDPPAAERTLRKRENTRARLIEAAADIVASKGIASTRIDDVVKQAGFTRGAFYSNYSSLQDILTEAIIMRSNTLLSRVTQAIDSFEGAPTMDSLMELLEAIRPEARTIYLLTTEYSLFQLRNPDSPTIPGTRAPTSPPDCPERSRRFSPAWGAAPPSPRRAWPTSSACSSWTRSLRTRTATGCETSSRRSLSG